MNQLTVKVVPSHNTTLGLTELLGVSHSIFVEAVCLPLYWVSYNCKEGYDLDT